MKEFHSIAHFVQHLSSVIPETLIAQHHGLEKAAVVIETEAKAEIGVYQDEIGDIVAWAELADSTKVDRLSKGFTENDPLLRTGELRDSIEHQSALTEAVVGSNSEIAVFQELGTEKMPPRSFLAGAAMRKEEEVVAILGESVVTALIGEKVLNGLLKLK